MTTDREVPDLLVERLACGELDADRAAAVQRRLETAGALDRLQAIERSNDEILAAYPPAAAAAAIAGRRADQDRQAAVATRRRWLWISLPALAAASAAALLLWVGPRLTSEQDEGLTGGSAIRLKGDPLLWVYRQEPAGARRLTAGQAVAAGDRLQVSYTAGSALHGAIVSVDGRGVVTLHFPSTAGGSTELDPSGPHLLDHSYELDDAPGFERFFFVTSERPIDVERLLAATRALGRSARSPLAPGPGLSVKEVLLPKQPALQGEVPP